MRYIFLIFIAVLFVSCTGKPQNAKPLNEYPDIFPDYTFVTIPSKIAPLNFEVKDDGKRFFVLVEGESSSITASGKRFIQFSERKWQKLLAENNLLTFTVWSKSSKEWMQYKPFDVSVKTEPVDSYLTYRRIAPGYQVWSSMGIYQRELSSFREDEIVSNRLFPGSCVNCHAFNSNDANSMMFHLRGNNGGTYFVSDTSVFKVNSKPEQLYSGFQYPYWHPSGQYVAFSINNTAQAFHAVADKRIEVFDSESDVVVYDVHNNKVVATPLLMSGEWFETFPSFSPDGMYLYFCTSKATPMPENYKEVKYNLCRIAFDAKTGTFGQEVDTLVRVADTNMSVTFPRISPDCKWLLFTLSDYGNFSIWHPEADLYMLNLETGEYCPLEAANSEDTESYHSWSSNSRWVVFSSRRVNGLYTMPYIVYINEHGEAEKPFLLPQKSPDYYKNSFYSFNIPEFVNGKVNVSVRNIENAFNSEGLKVK